MRGRRKPRARRRAPRADRRAAWAERGARAKPWAIAAIGTIALALGARSALEYARSGRAFAIDSIAIEGAERTERAAILRQARIAPGMNVFEVDPHIAAGALKGLPWIERAEVERRLPAAIAIRIVERRAAALVPWNDELWVSDERGRAIVALGPADKPWEMAGRLPLVTGAALGQPEGSERSNEIELALEALSIWDETIEDPGQRAIQAHLDAQVGVSIVTAAGAEVRLGRGRWAERARRFERAARELAGRGIEPDYALVDGDGPLEQIAVGPRRSERREGAARSEE